MNKILLIAGSLVVLSLVSCKEKGPLISHGAKATDTTYTATIETQQERVVLLEEFTGASCPPCPSGHKLIYGTGGIKEQHPDHVAVIAYHIFSFPQAEPVHDHAKGDFRTEDATNVGKTIFGGIGTLPTGGVDRIPANGVYLYETGSWPAAVNAHASQKPPVNVYITSTYDAGTRSATVKVKVAYTQSVAKKQNITLAIIENNIIDAQKDGLTIVDDYTHKSVLRDIITEFYGDPIMNDRATKEPGRVYERTFTFNVNAAWNADNCQLVAFVTDNEGDDKQVLQAAEVDLK